MQYIIHSIQRMAWNILYKIQDNTECTHTLYNIQDALYSIQYTVYSKQYTVYSIQYTVYSIQCTVYTMHNILHMISMHPPGRSAGLNMAYTVLFWGSDRTGAGAGAGLTDRAIAVCWSFPDPAAAARGCGRGSGLWGRSQSLIPPQSKPRCAYFRS